MTRAYASPTSRTSDALTPPVSRRDHVMGAMDAPVMLVVYGDYECPLCRLAEPIVKAALRELGGQLGLAFRNFPLSELHPHARHAAEAAEAAAVQGKFWEMHDMLFERQRALEDADLLHYAERLDLDTRRMQRELQARVHAKRVEDDFRSGIQSGVDGTPAFFVNEQRYRGWWPNEKEFIRMLRGLLLEELRSVPIPTEVEP
jgi:protein-disulfide isomerase